MKKAIKLLLLTLYFSSCDHTVKTNCNHELSGGDILLTDSLCLFLQRGESKLENGLCVMKYTFELGPRYLVNDEAIPEISFNGNLFKKNGILFLKEQDGNIITYCDLNMAVGQKQIVARKQGSGIKREHVLILEDKFYQDSLKDTIYKFRFSGITSHRGDIIFYLNSKVQFYGIYNGSIISDSTEEVYSRAGLVNFQSETKLKKRLKGPAFTE